MANSWFPGMTDALMQTTFLCAILMFWLCVYHGLRQNERKLLTFYVPKLLVILPIWLGAIVLGIWEKFDELNDPTYSHFDDYDNYNVRLVATPHKPKAMPFSECFPFYRVSRCSFRSPAPCICSISAC